MKLEFQKYQGTGNDFVIVDNRSLRFNPGTREVKFLCNRKFGIGSDGLILIENSAEADFKMVFFNPDGSMSFCGNGSRCAVSFAKQIGMVGNLCSFIAIDGKHEAVIEHDLIRIHMRDVQTMEHLGSDDVINTGSPHYIRYVEDVEQADLIEVARNIRYNEIYTREGINVNLVEGKGKGKLLMRTYERGVEDETLSCGTGVTAAAISYSGRSESSEVVEVLTRGGALQVSFKKQKDGIFTDIWLSGPAIKVFEGIINL